VTMSETGLAQLAADINGNITSQTPQDSVFLKAEAYGADEALTAFGPVPPPPTGWRAYLVANVFGGVQPGGFNTDIDILQARITANAKASDAWYRLALQNMPASGGDGPPPPPPDPRVILTDLKVTGAERTASGVWYQAYSPGQSITIQAVTDPAQPPSPPSIAWQGGQAHATGLPQLRAVPLNALTPFGQSLTVQATLGSVTKSVRLKVVPNLLRFDVSGAEGLGDGKWGVDPGDSKPAMVRVVTEPSGPEACRYLQWTGGEPCPDGGDNCCRLVPASAFSNPEMQMPVDVKVILE